MSIWSHLITFRSWASDIWSIYKSALSDIPVCCVEYDDPHDLMHVCVRNNFLACLTVGVSIVCAMSLVGRFGISIINRNILFDELFVLTVAQPPFVIVAPLPLQSLKKPWLEAQITRPAQRAWRTKISTRDNVAMKSSPELPVRRGRQLAHLLLDSSCL